MSLHIKCVNHSAKNGKQSLCVSVCTQTASAKKRTYHVIAVRVFFLFFLPFMCRNHFFPSNLTHEHKPYIFESNTDFRRTTERMWGNGIAMSATRAYTPHDFRDSKISTQFHSIIPCNYQEVKSLNHKQHKVPTRQILSFISYFFSSFLFLARFSLLRFFTVCCSLFLSFTFSFYRIERSLTHTFMSYFRSSKFNSIAN